MGNSGLPHYLITSICLNSKEKKIIVKSNYKYSTSIVYLFYCASVTVLINPWIWLKFDGYCHISPLKWEYGENWETKWTGEDPILLKK